MCTQTVVDSRTRSIERHQAFYRWDEHQTLLFAVSFLKSHADTWYRTLEASNNPPSTRSDFKSKLLAAFRSGNAYDIARDRLVQLRQTATIQHYVNEFRAVYVLIPDLNNLEAYDRFMRGIRLEYDQLFAELRAVPTESRSLELANQKALAFEASHVRRTGHNQVLHQPAYVPHSPNHDTHYDPKILDAIQQRSYSGNQESYR
ncbi:hypothetical protein A0J61_11312 [Choanephora cucurbitarum]|uniref:Retrotransposon gag domain-containing protein n=1 Tax=Choanephora cucurbitarum TaxID=101091 RepID=A0A1C7MV03_9FUNG|nr:hypothetical protein A0J61_11312 [Choanephora cucurbitarum]